MRKTLALLLCMLLCLSLLPPTFAVNAEAQVAAETLFEKGLFRGTGTAADGSPIFELERVPSRTEAITMLVRLLGAEEEALAGNWYIPFTDVDDWAVPYVGYAYQNGLTAGTSATTYGGDEPVTASQYITFMLRVLGYESGRDFAWDKAWEMSDKIGLTDGRYTAKNNSDFTRGDAAIISLALTALQPETPETPETPVTDLTIDQLMERTLTDSQIGKLQNIGLSRLRKYIATYGDFVAWVDTLTAPYYLAVDSRAGQGVMFGAEFLYVWTSEMLSGNMLASLGMYLLEDDYEGIGVIAGLAYDGDNRCVLASNYIPVEDGYLLLSAEEYCDVAKHVPFSPLIIPGGKVETLEDAVSQIPQSRRLAQLWQITTSEDRYFAYGSGVMTPEDTVGTALLYEDPDACLRTGSPELSTYGFQNAEDAVSDLTAEAAAKLRRGTIAEAAEAIDSMADVFTYLYYSGYTAYGYDLFVTDQTTGVEWHFNRLPERVFADNCGNCGGTSGLVAYLLDGDYDEVGIIGITFQKGEGGGHVINYIRDGDLYYVFDPVNLVSGGFRAKGLNLQYAATLKDAAIKWADKTTWNEKLMMAYESTTGDAPVGWNETNVTYMLAESARNMQILMEAESQGYQYVILSGKQTVLDTIALARSKATSSMQITASE